MAASHKVEKYVDLGAPYILEPIVVETLGEFSASAHHLGRRISLTQVRQKIQALSTRGS